MKNLCILVLCFVFLACVPGGNVTTDYVTDCNVEIVNQCGNEVFVKASICGIVLGDGGALAASIPAGGNRMFILGMAGNPSSLSEDNLLLRSGEIEMEFYPAADSAAADTKISYPYYTCSSSDDQNAWKDAGIPDSDFLYGMNSSSVTDALFVQDASRCFYLERDGSDPELGRIIITSVP